MVGKASETLNPGSPNPVSVYIAGKAVNTKRPHLFDFIYGSLPQLAEGNGSNPFKFRFESEVNYHEHCAITKFYQSRGISLKYKWKEEYQMKPTILSLENRIALLQGRTGRENGKIIKKLQRQLRALKT